MMPIAAAQCDRPGFFYFFFNLSILWFQKFGIFSPFFKAIIPNLHFFLKNSKTFQKKFYQHNVKIHPKRKTLISNLFQKMGVYY
jgi:hypothetical protein